MKFILVLIALLISYEVYAQTDADTPKSTKPSWSSKLPDRNDTPDLDTEVEPDDELSGLTMDRSDLFSDEEGSLDSDTNSETDASNSKDNLNLNELDKQAEADRLAKQAEADRQAKQAEADRQAKQAEADRQAKQAEADRQAKQAEADRLAKQAEADRLAKQAVADRLAKQAEADKKAEQINVSEQQITKQSSVNANVESTDTQEVNKKTYSWKILKRVAAEFPVKAARDKEEGWVEVEFTIDSSGNVIGAHPKKTYKNIKVFNQSALRAVRQWKFDPPINYGIQTQLTKTVRVVFKLE